MTDEKRSNDELPTMSAYELYKMLKDEFENRGVERNSKLFFVDKDSKRHEIKRLLYVYNGTLGISEERLIEVSDTRITGD